MEVSCHCQVLYCSILHVSPTLVCHATHDCCCSCPFESLLLLLLPLAPPLSNWTKLGLLADSFAARLSSSTLAGWTRLSTRTYALNATIAIPRPGKRPLSMERYEKMGCCRIRPTEYRQYSLS